jgi:hypothetical protein
VLFLGRPGHSKSMSGWLGTCCTWSAVRMCLGNQAAWFRLGDLNCLDVLGYSARAWSRHDVQAWSALGSWAWACPPFVCSLAEYPATSCASSLCNQLLLGEVCRRLFVALAGNAWNERAFYFFLSSMWFGCNKEVRFQVYVFTRRVITTLVSSMWFGCNKEVRVQVYEEGYYDSKGASLAPPPNRDAWPACRT